MAVLKKSPATLHDPGVKVTDTFQSYAGVVTATYPCDDLTLLVTHIEPFQLLLLPEGPGIIGQFPGTLPEYQLAGLKPEPPPNTLDEFH